VLFSSAPNLRQRNSELDFVRGIAILMVMAHHFGLAPVGHPILRALQTPGNLMGQTGVDVFFVLSGFLVGGLLLKEYKSTGTIRAKRFLLRRGLKIWPAYYFYIFAEVVVRKHPLNSFLVPNLLHLQNYLGTSLLHTWTLSIEEHFYLLLALAMAYMASRHWPADRMLKSFLWVIGGVIVIRCVTVYEGWPGAFTYTHDRLDALLFGVVLATLFHFFPEKFDRIASHNWILAGVAAAAVTLYAAFDSTSLRYSIGLTVLYIGYGAFLLLVYRHSGRFKEWRLYKWIAAIGLYSYGIYLWHNSVRDPLTHLSQHLPDAVRWPCLTVAEYAAAISVGVVTTLLIEWPFLKIRDRIFPDKTTAVPVTEEPQSPQVSAEPGLGLLDAAEAKREDVGSQSYSPAD
jgi:peptidoglycan/LPS O-acetylase OafA/YrhL